MRLFTDGKLEDARFILEDLAFRSPNDPNVLYNLGMVYSEYHELDMPIFKKSFGDDPTITQRSIS
ncbi:MAG: hypothetical protein Q7J35_13500 [Candidatus Methanoperedens sp.]|nr:hypothetical protein [Candidatus Methanoperedens sp.]